MLHAHVVCVVQEVCYLLFHTYESLPAGYVVHSYASVGVAQVRLGYRLEALLPRSIPKLELYDLTVYFHLLHFEIYSYGAALHRVEYVLGEAQQQRGLAGSRVSQHDDFVKSSDLICFHLFRVELHSFTNHAIPLSLLVYHMACYLAELAFVRRTVVVEVLKLILIFVVKYLTHLAATQGRSTIYRAGEVKMLLRFFGWRLLIPVVTWLQLLVQKAYLPFTHLLLLKI